MARSLRNEAKVVTLEKKLAEYEADYGTLKEGSNISKGGRHRKSMELTIDTLKKQIARLEASEKISQS